MKFQPVERHSNLSVTEFNREYRNRMPVVVTDELDGWRAKSAWTLEQFKANYGTTPVHVQGFDNGKPKAALDRTMFLSEYIDAIQAKDFTTFPFYFRDNYSMFIEHKELCRDFSHPKYCFDWFQVLVPHFMLRPGPRLFIGPKGSIQNLHQDMWGTYFWMAQLEGKKRWILFPPDHRELLYCGNPSPVKPDNPDFECYPQFSNARGFECVCGPGDLIIVPRDWFHWVNSLDPTVSLTHNYMGPGNFVSCLVGQFKWSFGVVRQQKANA